MRCCSLVGVVALLVGCSNPPAPLVCPPAAASPSVALSPTAATLASAPAPTLSVLPIASATPPAGPPSVLFDDATAAPGFLPRAEPSEVGLERARLDDLVREAEGNGSESLLIVKDGRVVAERYFSTPRAPIETMSITKSVVSLAVGMLIADGKISSIDAPISTWFPEWKEGRKGKVTLRHVLTHTSALEHRKGAAVLSSRPDRVKFARASRILDEPGKAFSYSNEATQLLSAIIKSAAGKPVDSFLRDRLFTPLGIKGWSWDRDKAGSTQTYYGLALTARDLAKLGMLMLADGTWEGKGVVPSSWVHQATSPAIDSVRHYGLLWWLRHDGTVRVQTPEHLEALRAAGLGTADKLRPMLERVFVSDEAWFLEAGSLLDPAERSALLDAKQKGLVLYATRPGEQIGYYADGWLGQKLGVYPASKLVAVRQHRRHEGTEEENQKAGFSSFYKMVEACVQEKLRTRN